MSDNPENRRMKKDMKGLLEFCASITKNEDPTLPSQPMEPEKQKFMNEVLSKVTTNTAEADLKETVIIITSLCQSGDWSQEHIQAVEDGLVYILDYSSDTPDNANALVNMGVTTHLLNLIDKFETCGMLATVLEIFAEVAQNNDTAKSHFASSDYIVKLMSLAETYPDVIIPQKAIYAIKSILRENHPGLEIFVDNKGFHWMKRLLALENMKISLKVSLLGLQLINDCESAKSNLLEAEIPQSVSKQLVSTFDVDQLQYDPFRENAVALLNKMCGRDQRCEAILSSDEQFIQYIPKRLKIIFGYEEHTEEIGYLEALSKRLKVNLD